MEPEALRTKLVEMLCKAKDGHPGSVMSLVEILCALNEVYDLKKDKLIISKAHGGMAIYPLLAELACFESKELESFRTRNGLLTMFPNATIAGIHTTLGSMGHGLGICAGMALGNSGTSFICILGEGEFYEGSVWEALLFISHHKLTNVKIVVDLNGFIVLGETEKLLKLHPLGKKIEAFGFPVRYCDGHDLDELRAALSYFQVVIAVTKKGKGVPAWEDKSESHYWIDPHVPA